MTLEDFVSQAIDRIQDIVHVNFPYDGPDQREEIKFVLLDLLTHGSETAVIHPRPLPFSTPEKLNALGVLTYPPSLEAPTSLVGDADAVGMSVPWDPPSLARLIKDLEEDEEAERISEGVLGTFTPTLTGFCGALGDAVKPGDPVMMVAPFEAIPGFRFQLLPDDCLDTLEASALGPLEESP